MALAHYIGRCPVILWGLLLSMVVCVLIDVSFNIRILTTTPRSVMCGVLP